MPGRIGSYAPTDSPPVYSYGGAAPAPSQAPPLEEDGAVSVGQTRNDFGQSVTAQMAQAQQMQAAMAASATSPVYQQPVQMPPATPPAEEAKGGLIQGLLGAGKLLLKAVTGLPILGQAINGVQALWDTGKLATLTFDPSKTPEQKSSEARGILADIAFHGAGVIFPFVGASYDIAKGTWNVAQGASRAFTQQPQGLTPATQMQSPPLPPEGFPDAPPFVMNDGGYPRAP